MKHVWIILAFGWLGACAKVSDSEVNAVGDEYSARANEVPENYKVYLMERIPFQANLDPATLIVPPSEKAKVGTYSEVCAAKCNLDLSCGMFMMQRVSKGLNEGERKCWFFGKSEVQLFFRAVEDKEHDIFVKAQGN